MNADPAVARPAPALPRAAWLVALLLVAAGWPGILSNDSLATLEQARTLAFTDWHPPIMALVWAPLDRILAGPGLMLVAQAVLYSLAMAWLLAEACPRLLRRASPWLLVPAFALFPPVAALNLMIWKDVWMSAWLVVALACLFRMARLPPGSSLRGSAGLLLACCLLATAFRHNALAATAGLLAGGAWFLLQGRFGPWLRLLAACVAGVVAAVLLYLAVAAATRLIATPAEVTTPILLHDIAGIIVHSGDAEATARQALAIAPDIADTGHRRLAKRVLKQYSPAAAVRLLSTRRRTSAAFSLNVYAPHDADAVKRAWGTLVRNHPGAYLRHRLAAFGCLVQLCDGAGWRHHSYVLDRRYAFPEGLPGVQAALRSVLLNPALAPLYAPLAWLALAVGGGLLALRRLGRGDGVPVFLMLSAVGLAVSLFFTSPIESYRYVHWIIVAGWTTAWLLLQRVLDRRAARARVAPRQA